MERETFFAAQLWLRRVDEHEFSWPTGGQQPQPGLTQLLPPLVRAPSLARTTSQSQPASQPQPTEVAPLTCSGYFHSESRICYFRATNANEDQTLLQVDMAVVEPQDASTPASLLLRLDRDYVYEVAVAEIQSVTLPERPRTTSSNNLPPFGSLDFGSVTLRLWLEPHDTPVAEARAYLVDALRRVENLRSQRREYDLQKQAKPHSWQDSFRHNRWVARRADKTTSEPWMEPQQLLSRGQDILSSDADKEALKMVITNFTQKKRYNNSCKEGLTEIREDSEEVHTAPANSQVRGTCALTEQQRFDLVASLLHVFGEDHPGLRQLLGSCAAEDCREHQGCSMLLSGGTRGCVMHKWQQWDEFLLLSGDAVVQRNKRQRTGWSSQSAAEVDSEDNIQAAGGAFVGAVLGVEEDNHLKAMHRAAKDRLKSLEDAAFGALFPIQSIATGNTGTPVTNAPQQAEPLTPVTPQRPQAASRQPTTPQTPQNLTHSKAEHTWNFLLESRRALVRQELALACLPRRTHQSTSS